MLTRDALVDLSKSLQDQLVLSVYIDGRVADPAARLTWRSILANNIAELRNESEARGLELRQFDRCVGLLEEELVSIRGALGAAGFVAFVTSDKVALAEKLPVPMPNVAQWENGPWVSPYLRAQKELRPVILVVVDARGARSYRYAQGFLTPLARFHAHAHVDQPTHMGSAPRQFFHSGTRGATTTDAVERAREEGTQRMLRELTEHILSVAPTDEWIVIGGKPTRGELLLASLPPAARQRAAVAPGVTSLSSVSILRRAAADNARRLRQRLDDQIVESAISHAAEHARGSVGERATRAALSVGAVHMLLLSSQFMSDSAKISEELARLALEGGATVEIVSGSAADHLDAAGGVAATLRFVASSAAPLAAVDAFSEPPPF